MVGQPTICADSALGGYMLTRRATAVACVIAPLAFLGGQVLLATMDPASSTLERIASSPAAWTCSHVLIAVAAASYVLVAGGLAGLSPGSAVARLGLLLVVTGAVLQGVLVGVDLTVGTLAASPDSTLAAALHRDIVDEVVGPLDRWSLLPTFGLTLLAVTMLVRRTLSAGAVAPLLLALAVPALPDLRIVAAAGLLGAFVVVAWALWRADPERTLDPLSRRLAWLVCLPFAAVAWVSLPRALLLVAVLGVVWLGLRRAASPTLTAR